MEAGDVARALVCEVRERADRALVPHSGLRSSRLVPHSSSSNNSLRSSTKLMAMTTTDPAIPKKKRGTTTFATRRMTRSIVP